MFKRKNGQTQSGTKKQKTQKGTSEAYRSHMKLVILGLSGLFLLTGCGSSPSIEDQAKLIEYQNCLEALRQVELDFNRAGGAGLREKAEAIMEAIDFHTSLCVDYRP